MDSMEPKLLFPDKLYPSHIVSKVKFNSADHSKDLLSIDQLLQLQSGLDNSTMLPEWQYGHLTLGVMPKYFKIKL